MLGGIWGCILSELKEYTPRPPKKNSGRDFDFPPRPTLKRPKERPAGLSFGNLSGVDGGRWDGRRRTKDGGAARRVVVPYGGCGEFHQPPWVAAHSGALAAAGAREGWESE